MTKRSFTLLLAIATAVNVLWAGAVTFRVLIDLPARHRLGPTAFAELSRATDLDRGLILYPVAAISSGVLAGAACFVAARMRAPRFVRAETAAAALACALVLVVTAWAAPIMFHIGAATDPEVLTRLADRFALLTNLRAVFADLAALALFCALSALALRGAEAKPGEQSAGKVEDRRAPAHP